jgi:ribosome biogenesis GTPase
VSLLTRLGWDPFFEQQRHALDSSLMIARVVEQQRDSYRLAGDVDGLAEVSGRFRHRALSHADFPSVGDWVAVRDQGSGGRDQDVRVIDSRFERRSTISRAAAGRASSEQVIAANVDTLLIVTAAVQDLNARRLERYLTAVYDSGAVPVVVINKVDLAADAELVAAGLRARLPLVDVVGISALTADLAALEPYLRPARTLALVGSSGVGKSTIINRLLGREVVRTSAVSAADGRGRHTTTARQLIELSNGALLVDTPGMRELTPWVDEEAAAGAFDDIETFAAGCRFGDCNHDGEPGCAVAAAIADGRLQADRLENYRRLLREIAYESRKHDKAATAELKRKWKRVHQSLKHLDRLRGRS